MIELGVRFVLGGLLVSLFAAIGEMFKSKKLAGVFGAAPSIAIASLAIAFHTKGSRYAAIEARFMLLGAAAMLVYAGVCLALTKQRQIPVWLGAGAAWFAWLATAFSTFGLIASAGAVP